LPTIISICRAFSLRRAGKTAGRDRTERGWLSLNLRDFWQYRDLLYILRCATSKCVISKPYSARVGDYPAAFHDADFYFVFRATGGNAFGRNSVSAVCLRRLLPWTFFSNAVTGSGNSLVGNSNLITKIYFPRMIIPIASVASGLLDFLIAFGLLVFLMFYYAVGLSINILMLPVLVILTSLLAIGIGMWMSALNVKFRDIRYALPFLIQLGMFATPIIYPSSLVPEKWRWLLSLNPLTGQIEAYRSAFFGNRSTGSLGISAVLTLAILFTRHIRFGGWKKVLPI
jgi:lipopolysaccharide transport system permease protein